jgi:hypothetical protein
MVIALWHDIVPQGCRIRSGTVPDSNYDCIHFQSFIPTQQLKPNSKYTYITSIPPKTAAIAATTRKFPITTAIPAVPVLELDTVGAVVPGNVGAVVEVFTFSVPVVSSFQSPSTHSTPAGGLGHNPSSSSPNHPITRRRRRRSASSPNRGISGISSDDSPQNGHEANGNKLAQGNGEVKKAESRKLCGKTEQGIIVATTVSVCFDSVRARCDFRSRTLPLFTMTNDPNFHE